MLRYLKYIYWFIIITIWIFFTSLWWIATIFGISFWVAEVRDLMIIELSLSIWLPFFMIWNIIIFILYKILNKLHYRKLMFLSYFMITLSCIGALIYWYLIIESFSSDNWSNYAIQMNIYSVMSFFFCIFYVIIWKFILNKTKISNQNI